jgi:hypothetical protein
MKTSTKLIITGTATLIAAAAILGGVQVVGALNQLAAPIKHSISLGTPTPAATATKAPVVVDPVVAAQTASGLTTVQYQAVTAQAAKFSPTMDVHVFNAQLAQLATQYGKPVVIVAYSHCPIHGDNPTAMSWGISGALYGNNTGCGTGYEATRAGTLAKVTERAADKGWTANDYVLVFADWSK